MRRTYLARCAAAAIVWCGLFGAARAQLPPELVSQYRPAVEKLRQAYTHATIEGTSSLAYPGQDKSREQRMDWMAVAVFPKMRLLFQEQDSEKYADFSCQTCHGREMERVDFRMPNDLFALDAEDTVAHAKEYDERTTDFMLGAVVPEMAKLLDVEAFTLENQQGFGCAGCHPTAK